MLICLLFRIRERIEAMENIDISSLTYEEERARVDIRVGKYSDEERRLLLDSLKR